MVALTKRKQDEFQAFYTNCSYITSYMVSLLRCQGNVSILEPCAGDGAFIEELKAINNTPNITAYELNSDSVNILQSKYSDISSIKIKQEDFLLPFQLNFNKFDRVIGNPPYGAYQSPAKRKQLKNEYPQLYAKETYGLFLVKAMESLKKGGRLVFIVPDTYLTLHMHEGLRKELLQHYEIELIVLFPSNFFPGVNFGYAGLSIISIVNKVPNKTYSFPAYNGLSTSKQLLDLLTEKRKKYEICRLTYSQLSKNPSSAFLLSSKDWINSALSTNNLKVGNICSVVTGFYSGNDGKYLRRSKSVTRGIKKYALINTDDICNDDLSITPPLDGLNISSCWVPIVKGGNKKFYKNSEWFMNWSKEALYDYKVTNKKRARFQNPQYYFHQGIGVPMVSSSSITGSLIDGRLFDQSIVGIFPKKKYEYLTYFFLGLFNSNVCNALIRTINASTNNSANYIKKIPVIMPNKIMLNQISNEVRRILILAKKRNVGNDDLVTLNEYYNKIYGSTNT
ncbi:N-6 DNA methylase [Thiotrichales bacterium HSG1]|nr:N-6 DNA methylase [Thiotrichales bacterium HSG1]